ncbi:hypothetical protein BH10PLA2_BH10PLA2_00180 [soil metagenome]
MAVASKIVKMIVLGIIASAANASMAQRLNPKDYAVPVYMGPRAKPDFTGEGRQYLNYRTAITNGFRSNPLTAGHYTVITVGCGTACTFHWIGDVRSGKILPFPVGGEDYPQTEIITKPDARLLVVKWGDYGDNDCHARLYAFTNEQFKQIGPDKHKGSGCDAR